VYRFYVSYLKYETRNPQETQKKQVGCTRCVHGSISKVTADPRERKMFGIAIPVLGIAVPPREMSRCKQSAKDD